MLNALALLMIAGGLAAYFNAYPTIKFVNKTISVPTQMDASDLSSFDPNPARGVCLPIILKFCQNHKIPYNYTVFPNYIGHFGQLEAQLELDQVNRIVSWQRFYKLIVCPSSSMRWLMFSALNSFLYICVLYSCLNAVQLER